jgi:hypothetical protein
MLHPKRVAKTLYYAMRRRLRKALGATPRRSAAPVLGFSMDIVVERHGWICRSILQHSPPDLDLRGHAICEVGAGDCLASSSLFLAKGARHVNIVEIEAPVASEKQLDILQKLHGQGLPMDFTILRRNGGWHLDESRISYHRCFMEDFEARDAHQFLFSFSVLEHVEDLKGFYTSCWRALAPGGWMVHLIDLGGHELFEDPLPPLDFQTYPDWLYNLMYPKYHRATRRFLNEHVDAVRQSGFRVEKVTPTRKADAAYLDGLWPKLRASARIRPREEIEVVEFALLARKE